MLEVSPDDHATQSELNLFLLTELERLYLLVARLQARGVLRPEDTAFALLQSELKQEERRLRIAVTSDDVAGVQKSERAIHALETRIRQLSAA